MSETKYNQVKVRDNVVTETIETAVEKRELKSIVSVEPVKVKKGLLGRLARGFVGPDGSENIGQYITEEIVKPAINNIVIDVVQSTTHAIVEAVTTGITTAILGENAAKHIKSRPNSYGYRHNNSHSSQYTNYTSRYTSTNQPPAQQQRNERSNRHGVDEYLIKDRYDASHVLTTLTEQADMYDTVSVADYYDLIGIASEYTDNQYGWSIDTIVRATIAPVRGGYVLKLPPVEVI